MNYERTHYRSTAITERRTQCFFSRILSNLTILFCYVVFKTPHLILLPLSSGHSEEKRLAKLAVKFVWASMTKGVKDKFESAVKEKEAEGKM